MTYFPMSARVHMDVFVDACPKFREPVHANCTCANTSALLSASVFLLLILFYNEPCSLTGALGWLQSLSSLKYESAKRWKTWYFVSEKKRR